jgi:NhaA family Na+:H+ antiporter
MLVPAGIYLALLSDGPAARGWGIPMATDIAFVVGCMAMLGRRVNPGLRVMLLSLAIADDVGAILVIAIGYTESLGFTSLLLGFAGIGLVVGLNRVGVRSVGIYTLLGAGIWLAFHESGVHATIAGVILGLLTPTGRWVGRRRVYRAFEQTSEFLHGDLEEEADREVLERARILAREAISPLERLEAQLHPWTSFGIMPIFALANAGVAFSLEDFGEPVAIAVALGLVVGKPIGVFGFAFAAVRLGLARLPEGVTWPAVAGAGLLAGIGFTMALFIAGLALDGPALDAAKVGILGGSLLAALGGVTLLILADRSARS